MLDEPLNGIDLLGKRPDYEEHSEARSRCDTGSSSHLVDELERVADDHFYERWYFGKSVHGRGALDQSTQIRSGSVP